MSTMDDETAIAILKKRSVSFGSVQWGNAVDKGITAIETLALIKKAWGGVGSFEEDFLRAMKIYLDHDDSTALTKLAGEE